MNLCGLIWRIFGRPLTSRGRGLARLTTKSAGRYSPSLRYALEVARAVLGKKRLKEAEGCADLRSLRRDGRSSRGPTFVHVGLRPNAWGDLGENTEDLLRVSAKGCANLRTLYFLCRPKKQRKDDASLVRVRARRTISATFGQVVQEIESPAQATVRYPNRCVQIRAPLFFFRRTMASAGAAK
jgi:hypothetical protein